MLIKIGRLLWLILFIFAIGTSAFGQDLLKESDVNNIMKQIFSEHVDKKEMSQEILQHSFKVYIDQFDPNKIYLLKDEIQSYLTPSDAEIKGYIEQYKKGDFSSFEKLNGVIQKSISRARDLRAAMEKKPAPFFAEAEKIHYSKAEEYRNRESTIDYAKNLEQLKQRNGDRLAHFINVEMHQYGIPAVMSRQEQVLDFYSKALRENENHYLFVNQNNEPLSIPQRDNLMTLHILKALANSLDSHTTFFDPSEANEMKVHLEKELHGIGVVLQQGVDGVMITKLISDGPAAKSGKIMAKDQILEIDGKSTSGLTFAQIRELIAGKDGSTVNLKIKRKTETDGKEQIFALTLTRSPIVVDQDRVDMSYEKFGNGIIGKLVLHSFYQGDNGVSSEIDLRKAIQDLRRQGNLRGLILDMRENGGGFLTQAVKVSGLFISNGIVVISKYSNGEEHFYRDIEGKKAFDGPLIILTSKVTASAAEIVAETLQDYGVALVVGDSRTFGKGSIQSQTVTGDKSTSYFKVTVGKYYTVSGKSPQIRGVEADIVVPGPLNNENIGEKYTDAPLTPDTIPPAFNDNLKDISADYKPWFLKYYIPTLQQPIKEWKEMVPTLKKNSEYRIANNKSYQLFLKRDQTDLKDEAEEAPLNESARNFGKEDLQMGEAVSIMKDMITLHSFWDSHTAGLKDQVTQGADR